MKSSIVRWRFSRNKSSCQYIVWNTSFDACQLFNDWNILWFPKLTWKFSLHRVVWCALVILSLFQRLVIMIMLVFFYRRWWAQKSLWNLCWFFFTKVFHIWSRSKYCKKNVKKCIFMSYKYCIPNKDLVSSIEILKYLSKSMIII